MKTPRHPELSFVCVVWNDAVSRDEERDAEDVENEPTMYQTYGWLVKQTDKAVTVCSDVRPADLKFRDRTTIPMGMVIEIVPLHLAKARQKKEKEVSNGITEVR